MRSDLVERLLDHLFYEEFAVTKSADGPSGSDLPPTLRETDLTFVVLAFEVSCFAQALFAVGVAAEMAVTVLKVRDFPPRFSARVAALRRVVMLA